MGIHREGLALPARRGTARPSTTTLRAIAGAWREGLAACRQYEELRSSGVPHDRAVREALGLGLIPSEPRPHRTVTDRSTFALLSHYFSAGLVGLNPSYVRHPYAAWYRWRRRAGRLAASSQKSGCAATTRGAKRIPRPNSSNCALASSNVATGSDRVIGPVTVIDQNQRRLSGPPRVGRCGRHPNRR